jgi:hypothetical protein
MKTRSPLALTLAGLVGATLLCSPLVYAQSSSKVSSSMTTEHATAQPKQTAHSSKQSKKKSTTSTHAAKKKHGEKTSSQMQ